MIRLLHCITSLDTGGAQMMLHKVVQHLDGRKFSQRVVSLAPAGEVGQRIQARGVPVFSLELSRARPDPRALWRLAEIVRDFKPHVIMTWLYHADLLGLLAVKMVPGAALAWNIRCSGMDLEQYSRMTALVRCACAMFSRVPDAVVANSSQGRAVHQKLGYRPKRFDVIPNGFDLDVFAPDPVAAKQARREWGIPENALVAGMAARFDPMKGHDVFCRAAGMVHAKMPDVFFLLCGEGMEKSNPQLASWIAGCKIQDRCKLLGRRDDMPRFYAALDVFCLSSVFGEGFPNVAGEAMACGVPCVVTDVGDAGLVVGQTGLTVPPSDAEALGQACMKLLSQDGPGRANLGQAARQRVRDNYSIQAVARMYEKLFEDLCGHGI